MIDNYLRVLRTKETAITDLNEISRLVTKYKSFCSFNAETIGNYEIEIGTIENMIETIRTGIMKQPELLNE